MKKVFLGIMVLMLVILAACSTKTPEPSPTPSEGSWVELTAWNDREPPQGLLTSKASDTKVGLSIAKASGVSFTVNYTAGDKETNFNLRLAANNWEDVIMANSIRFDWTAKLVAAKQIIALDEYFNQPEKYPNLAKIPKEVLDNFRYSDGHIYQFPSQWYEDQNSVYGYWAASGWYLNPDILAKVNMTQSDLATIDGVGKFLVAVKNAKLKDANGNPIIPLSGSQNINLWKTIASTFGVSTAGDGFQLQADGKTFLNYRDDARLKSAMTWLNSMNRAGVVDPELVSQKNEQLQTKLTSERVALVPDQAWGFWGLVTAGPGPATKLAKLPFPKAPGADKLGIQDTYNPLGTSGAFVTTNCKNPDAVAKYADWSSVKGVQRGWEMNFGPRGLYWDWDATKGEPFYATNGEFKAASAAGDYKKLNELGFSSVVNLAPFDLDLNYYNPDVQETLAWIFDMHKFNVKQGYIEKFKPYYQVKVPADGLWLKNIGTLNKLDTEYFTKMISAKSDGEFTKAWNDYQAQLESQGNWTAVKAEWNATYAATAKN